MTDLEILQKIKQYIEETEVANDTEWGSGRRLDELICDGAMPDLYKSVVDRLNDLKLNTLVRSLRFAITLTDDQFCKLSDRSQHLIERLFLTANHEAEILIQRESDE